MRCTRLTLFLAGAIAAVVLVASPARAQQLQPKTYKSPSGKYALAIDPEDRSGAGKGRFTMRRGSSTVWSKELPFTLWDAAVADDGVVGGYAYIEGYERDAGDLIVAIIDANGDVRTEQHTPHNEFALIDLHSGPVGTGLIMDAANDRFVVRVDERTGVLGEEVWWTYRLSDGRATGRAKPAAFAGDRAIGSIVAAQPIAGTPLTLVQWLRSDDCNEGTGRSHLGASFALIGPDLKPVWTLSLPRDYRKAEEEAPLGATMIHLRTRGAILEATQPKQFSLWHVADGQRVSYAIAADAEGTGWSVRETGRSAYTAIPAPATNEAQALSRATDLPLAGKIVLDSAAGDTGAIHDLGDFSVADRGRFAFITDCGCNGASDDAALAVVDRTGRLLRKIPLPAATQKRGDLSYHQTWLGGDRWIVTRSPFGPYMRSTAFVVDAQAGTAVRLADFDAPDIKAVASTRDGGFVAITTLWADNTMTDALSAFAADGTLRWTIGEDIRDAAKIFSAEDVTVTTEGAIVVLENIAGNLKVFDRSGAYRQTVELAPAFKRAPSYPSGIKADLDGGVIVNDFEGHPPIVRMKLDGHATASFEPRFSEGRKFDVVGDVQVADDRSLWTSDGSALLRLDERGVVQAVVGRKPSGELLDNVAALAIGANGWIYAVDERTAAVHVFDGAGKTQHVCRPAPKDYDGRLYLPSLTIGDAGDVFVTRGEYRGNRELDFLHYTAAGLRAGVVSVRLDEVAQDWYAQPGTTRRWVVGFVRAYLVGGDGRVVRDIDRQSDVQWLESPGPASVAPDGSIAIVSGAHAASTGRGSGNVEVGTYSREGDPQAAWPVPDGFVAVPGRMAYDGRTIALVVLPTNDGMTGKGSIALIDAHDGTLRSFEPGLVSDSSSVFLTQRAGRVELWLFDGRSTIRRYAMK